MIVSCSFFSVVCCVEQADDSGNSDIWKGFRMFYTLLRNMVILVFFLHETSYQLDDMHGNRFIENAQRLLSSLIKRS